MKLRPLPPRAQAIFDETLEFLPEPTPLQFLQLGAYAVETARWEEAEQWLQEHGTTVTVRDDKGIVRQLLEAPQVRIAERAQDRSLQLASELDLQWDS